MDLLDFGGWMIVLDDFKMEDSNMEESATLLVLLLTILREEAISLM